MSVSDQIREVLEAHPIVAGEGHYAGELICAGCHLCLNPATHLLEALSEVLDPEYAGPTTTPGREAADPRESQISWGRHE